MSTDGDSVAPSVMIAVGKADSLEVGEAERLTISRSVPT